MRMSTEQAPVVQRPHLQNLVHCFGRVGRPQSRAVVRFARDTTRFSIPMPACNIMREQTTALATEESVKSISKQ